MNEIPKRDMTINDLVTFMKMMDLDTLNSSKIIDAYEVFVTVEKKESAWWELKAAGLEDQEEEGGEEDE